MTPEQHLQEANGLLKEANDKLKQSLQLHSELNQIKEENKRLREALFFYADPNNYLAVMVVSDRPAGDFANDVGVFDSDVWDFPHKPIRHGHTARVAIGDDTAFHWDALSDEEKKEWKEK